MRLTAFTKYDRLAASTRQRLLQFEPALLKAGIELDYRPLLGPSYIAGLATGRAYSRGLLVGDYARRLHDVAHGPLGDVVWIYGELFPYLPGSFERLVVRRARPIIYDWDDAFFLTYDEHPNSIVRRLLRGKLQALMAEASACTCGNAYLRDYSAQYCPHSVILPTTVDTEVYLPARKFRQLSAPVVIGWIGSPSTWKYVRPLLPLLAALAATGTVLFRAVGGGPEARADAFEGMEAIDWSEESEVAEVQAMDIGIMPLPEEGWARGKSGYKLIQYMACGLPVVASPVGVNTRIVVAQQTGFLAANLSEWRAALEGLIADQRLRHRLGAAARHRAERRFSLARHAPRLVALVKSVADRRGK